MPVTSTLPTSRRGYLSQNELAQYADITILDTTEADDQIGIAEEAIDAFVGFQQKFLSCDIAGYMSASASTTFTLYSQQVEVYDKDYFLGCEVEIIGGTGQGQRRKITGSTRAGVVTIDSAWTVTPDTTSFYRIYQLGKFPRSKDVRFFSETGTPTYFKSIPEAVKRAVAAQVEYKINMGDKFFSTDKSDKQSESIGDYSYSNSSNGAGGAARLLAPKARNLLKGITNKLGIIDY